MDVSALSLQLDTYLAGVDLDAVAASMANAAGSDLAAARHHLATHVGEVQVAMRLVGPVIDVGTRVLEVGSGIGLFAGFLRSMNVDITELEPVGMGFEFIGEARSALAGYTKPAAHLDIGVERLRSDLHGPFDLIFSVNVLEHVADWRIALEACASVLAHTGQMVHTHPNYSVPYEPHFSVPLIPFRPARTSWLLPHRITATDVWSSLNWITARQVRRWCNRHGFDIRFRRGVLAATLERLSRDPLFRQRHGSLVNGIATMVSRLGLTGALKRLPATMATPVEYSIRRRG